MVRFGDFPVTIGDDPTSEKTHNQINGELDGQENLDEIQEGAEDFELLELENGRILTKPRENKKARRAGRAHNSPRLLHHSVIGTDRRNQGQKEYALRAIKQVIFHVGLFRIRQFSFPIKTQLLFDPIAILIHGLTRFLASHPSPHRGSGQVKHWATSR